MAAQQRWPVREVARQIDSGLFERAVLNPPKLSTALREMQPQAEQHFKDAYQLEFLALPQAHSSQGGKTSAATSQALSTAGDAGEAAPDAAGHRPEPELDRLSNILKRFNEHFGTHFADTDRVAKRIRDDVAPKVAADVAYQNAQENTPRAWPTTRRWPG